MTEIDGSRHRRSSGCYSHTSKSSVEMCQWIRAEQRMLSLLVHHLLVRMESGAELQPSCVWFISTRGGQCAWIYGFFQCLGSYKSSDHLLSRVRHQSSLAVPSTCLYVSVFVLWLHIWSVGDVSDRLWFRLTDLFVFAQGQKDKSRRTRASRGWAEMWPF